MQQLVFCFLRFSFKFNYWQRNRSVRYYCGQIGRTGPERRFSIHDSFVTHSYAGSQSGDGSSALPSLTSSFIDGAASWTDGHDTTRKSPSLTRKAQQQSSQTDSNRGRQHQSTELIHYWSKTSLFRLGDFYYHWAVEYDKQDIDIIIPHREHETSNGRLDGLQVDRFVCQFDICSSVVDPSYFDDEQRRQGLLLTPLAIMEHTRSTLKEEVWNWTGSRKAIHPNWLVKIVCWISKLLVWCPTSQQNRKGKFFVLKIVIRQHFES